MKFSKEDENYIYEVISKNIKKYRKLKGWTQVELADKINYSLAFIRGIESSYLHTFSFGAIWRIAQVLEVDFSKLCEDEEVDNKSKSIVYKCSKCGIETKFPASLIRNLKNLNEINGNNNLPSFPCTNEECDGRIFPVNPMDF